LYADGAEACWWDGVFLVSLLFPLVASLRCVWVSCW
jgi:hypothetical protein